MDDWAKQRETLIGTVKFMVREVQLTVRCGETTPYDSMDFDRMNHHELCALRQQLADELFDPDSEGGAR